MQTHKIIPLIIVIVFIAVFVSSCHNGNKPNNKNAISFKSDSDTAKISFKEYEHDFGKVTEGEKVAYVFTFINAGNSPLVITSATASCGCTVPKFDENPIPPGGSGNLEVVFDSTGKSGKQTKTITVKSNASKPLVILKITAEVISNINQ